MSISVGGLGLVSFRSPFAELYGMVLGKGDVRSLLCLVVFCIVSLVLAYLTNPSENSFRAYLTEQSFRQHLSRLDDANDDDIDAQEKLGSKRGAPTAASPTRSFDNSSPFHFANRASISLRTPKHVFHSFGLFTIAAMVPLAKAARTNDDALMISDSWYIGAFGRWWRGGVIEAWYQDVISRSKDEESWSSGILAIKSLDMLNDYNGLPFSTKNLPPHFLGRGSPPRLRNRERSLQRPALLSVRSSTPPPLSKSASLPLHAARVSPADRPSLHLQPLVQSPGVGSAEQVRLGSPLPSRSPSALFDQSPLIADVLHQISISKASVLDLRTQVTDYQSTASQGHALLQGEVDSYRDRKRQEDTSRLELKSRTKTLDDAKRHAESMKRDAEKKLKTAQSTRDRASQRIDHLDKDIVKLQQRLLDDEAFVRQCKETVSEPEQEITDALEQKKEEIKVTEDDIIKLSLRARELEDKLSAEKERLQLVREHADTRKQEQAFHAVGLRESDLGAWAHDGPDASFESNNGMFTRALEDLDERQEPFPDIDTIVSPAVKPSLSLDLQTVTRPNNLPPIISNFSSGPTPDVSATQAALRANGYSIFDDVLASMAHPPHRSTKFSPFGDHDDDPTPQRPPGIMSPTSSSLIPSSLMTSFDNGDGLSRSFQSENDAFLDSDWRGNMPSFSHHFHGNDYHRPGFVMTTSPTSTHGPSANDYEHDPFEVRVLSAHDRRRDRLISENPVDVQRTLWLQRTQSSSNPNNGYELEGAMESAPTVAEKLGPRRWFSSSFKEKPKKGLNPDAKVFSLASQKSPRVVVGPSMHSAYDALNPNGLGRQAMSSAASANSSLLRAFAPSPAEREALQRALGGSANTSFERLPSLSDVGSMPSSPAHVHTLPASPHVDTGKILPSWLMSLPRFRKVNFSPWDDEEPTVIDSNSENGHHKS